MVRLTFGNSDTGVVEEVEIDTASIQITYATIRTEEDNEIAYFSDGFWRRQEGPLIRLWTDIAIRS